jgi:c-di-GMP-binding flagellar brake protein YcgR
MRSERRYPRRREPNVVGSLSFSAEGRVVDISSQGLGLECHDALPPTRGYRFTLRDSGRQLKLAGRTVWNRLTETRRTDEGEVVPVYRAGVRFEHDSATHQVKVREFISHSGARPVGSRRVPRYRPTRESSVLVSCESGFVVRTISESGALLETDSVVPRASSLSLSLQLPSGAIEVEGRLVSTRREVDETGEPCTRLAVEFQDLTPEGHRKIGRLVAAGP